MISGFTSVGGDASREDLLIARIVSVSSIEWSSLSSEVVFLWVVFLC